MCLSMAKATREKIVLVLGVLSLISVYGAAAPAARKYLTDSEIKKELKCLNKPAIKSIKVVFFNLISLFSLVFPSLITKIISN